METLLPLSRMHFNGNFNDGDEECRFEFKAPGPGKRYRVRSVVAMVMVPQGQKVRIIVHDNLVTPLPLQAITYGTKEFYECNQLVDFWIRDGMYARVSAFRWPCSGDCTVNINLYYTVEDDDQGETDMPLQ